MTITSVTDTKILVMRNRPRRSRLLRNQRAGLVGESHIHSYPDVKYDFVCVHYNYSFCYRFLELSDEESPKKVKAVQKPKSRTSR